MILSRIKGALRKYPFYTFSDHLVYYPTPSSLNYWWGFGSLAGIFLSIQIATGIFLAMHYVPNTLYAFSSLEHIMRDVNYGWFLRYSHAVGASIFFLLVYAHLARGLYYGSYTNKRKHVWSIGIIIFVLMIATAFMGYVLPWGQMSFWGATVITNLFTAFPYVGESIAYWLWGGFSVDNATLNRFFSLHYLLPFAIFGLVFMHLSVLHYDGSSNPLGTIGPSSVPFYPYFYIKDFIGFVVLFCLFSGFVLFYPNYLGHPDNYMEASALVTPTHIVPEWYFLPFYAILRAIPSKLHGVVVMALAIVVLWMLPYLDTRTVRSGRLRRVSDSIFWLIVCDFMLLGWVGSRPVEAPFVLTGQFATFAYFALFLVALPSVSRADFEILRSRSR